MSVPLGNLESYALCLGSIWMLPASSSNTRPWCIHARFTYCEQPLPESCFKISRSLKLCPGGGEIPPQTTCDWRRYPGRDLLAGHVTVLRLFLLSVGVCVLFMDICWGIWMVASLGDSLSLKVCPPVAMVLTHYHPHESFGSVCVSACTGTCVFGGECYSVLPPMVVKCCLSHRSIPHTLLQAPSSILALCKGGSCCP